MLKQKARVVARIVYGVDLALTSVAFFAAFFIRDLILPRLDPAHFPTGLFPLSDYLKQVHDAAILQRLLEVSCDFRKLTFMNSSCFKAFVVWIDSVKNLAAPYKIRFLTDPNIHWQRRSLEALRRLAIQIVTLET